jgi:4'-phosphopantetheinyl transferase
MVEPLVLPADEVHVWRASLNRSEPELDQMLETLAADERARAERFIFLRDRQHFVAGRGLLRAILGKYLQRSPEQLCFACNAYGKPALAGMPAAKALHFNLAHSNGLALFAVSWNRELGVDVEYLRADRPEERIAARFFSAGECSILRRLPAHERTNAFYVCWTRKEAYIKARGLGLSLPLEQFDVSLAPGEAPALLASREDPKETTRWSLCDLAPGSSYRSALAVAGRSWRLECRQWPDWA